MKEKREKIKKTKDVGEDRNEMEMKISGRVDEKMI